MSLRRSLFLLLLTALLDGSVRADDEGSTRLAQADTGLGRAEIVGAILSYTLWPGPERGLVVCVSRGATDATAILAHLQQLKLRWALMGRMIEAEEPVPSSCDLVYFDGWDLQAQRQALRALSGRAVLSIGWGAEFCSDGGLFCLSPGTAGLRFEVNLDAVSRSDLRVHPQVLRLTRPRTRGAT